MANQFIQLTDNGNNLYPKTLLNIFSYDYNNVLFSASSKNIDYTSTTDCIAMIGTYDSRGSISIDGVDISNNYDGNVPLLLKKGQHVIATYTNSYPKVYGIINSYYNYNFWLVITENKLCQET